MAGDGAPVGMQRGRSRVRVLVVSAWSPYRATDGDSLVLAHHLRHLGGRHDVVVLSADSGAGDEPAGGPLPASVEVRGFGADRQHPVRVVGRRWRGLRTGEPDHVAWVERPALLAALAEELASRRPDVVHLFGWGTAQLWARTDGVPCVHMPVDTWTDGVRNRALPGWRRLTDLGQHRRVRAHERRHYPRCHAVAVVSPGEAERTQAVAPGARVAVVANGVDAGPEPERRPDPRPTIAFHGRYGTRANAEAARFVATEVLPELRRLVPDVRLLLIGSDVGPDVAALAGDAVEVTGPVDDVRAALGRAHVYVAGMVSGTGIKNKVLEAMAAALPVVATPLALDGIGEGPGVVAAPTSVALAEAAVSLLADPELAAQTGRAGRARVVAEHGWDRSAAAIERLWLEAAGR